MAEGPARVGWRVVRGVWGGGRALKPAIQGRWGVKLSISLLILVRAMLLRASQGSYSLQRRGVGPKCNLHACMSDVSAKLLYTVTVSTSSIVYIKSDFRKPSSLYSLHIKHSHTHTHTYAQYHTTAYQPLSSLWASPATSTTTSTANICDSILTGSLDWAIYSADQHSTYLALKPRIWQLQQYSHP